MKLPEDLARSWWRKGDSDLTNARMCLEAKQALDTACFHAQQAAEKYLRWHIAATKLEPGCPHPVRDSDRPEGRPAPKDTRKNMYLDYNHRAGSHSWR